MSSLLKGKVAIVTGSGQGIGRGIAVGLAAEGAKIVTNNRKRGSTDFSMVSQAQVKKLDKKRREWFEKETAALKGDAETAAQEINKMGGEAVPCFADISDYDAAGTLIQTAINSFGKIDILVNAAGEFGFSPIEKMSEEMWDRVTMVKPKGYFNTTRHALPYMIKQKWGRILNCTSRAFWGDIIKHAEYCTANAGVIGLTLQTAIEMRRYGITCNAFSPFAVTRAAYQLEVYDETVSTEDSQWVFGKPANIKAEGGPGPEYLAPYICYLSSDAAKDITASIFNVGGNGIGLYSDPVIARSMTKPGREPWTVEELMEQAPRGLFAGYRSLVDSLKF
jgi:3-oxoacyl-[acyl-carrier protein] reductase